VTTVGTAATEPFPDEDDNDDDDDNINAGWKGEL
jgi:hypothetical protein